jgi:alkaline phosphatase
MKHIIKRSILLVVATLCAVAVHAVQPAKYVILMIGDGMGPTQVQVAEAYQLAKTGRGLAMNTLPFKGITTTHSADNPVTDSAAAGTALACGQKVANKVISFGLETVAERAKKGGKKVGIISSVPIDHATPSCFYAHQDSRNSYYQIAASLPESGFDYFAGQSFLGEKKAGKQPKPVALAKKGGYQVIDTPAAFQALTKSDQKTVVLTDLPYTIDQKGGEITLADLTQKGLQLLDNPDGFFMMVEGGKIDWAGHAHDLATAIKETLAFDDAVAIALEFYNAHPAETLLLVTADHETGGLSFDGTTPFNYAALDQQKLSSEVFTGKVRNWTTQGLSLDEALQNVESDFGLTDLTEAELAQLKPACEAAISGKVGKKISPELAKMYGNRNPAVLSGQNIIAQRCGAQWTEFHHTATLVPARSIGVNAEAFSGQTDNAQVGQLLRSIIDAD